MVRKLYTALLLAVFCLSFSAMAGVKQRMVLHITPDGKQEAIQVQPNETMKDVISKIEKGTAQFSPLNVRDSLTNGAGLGAMNVNFGFNGHDIGFQWWVPPTDGNILEFWWFNFGSLHGDLNQTVIQAWIANPRLLTLPATAYDGTGRMGYYKDGAANTGANGWTAFKPATGDQAFYKGNGGDSAKICFDPLGTESAWKAGGTTVTMAAKDSAKWQGIKFSDYSSTPFAVKKGLPFGISMENLTIPPLPVGSNTDARMEIYSWTGTQAPWHSIKWYSSPAAAGNQGWQIRSYEWGFYVVIDYTGDRPPKLLSMDHLYTTIKTTTRALKAKYSDDNPSGGPAGVAKVMLFNKKNSLAWDSTAMTGTEPNYTGNVLAAAVGDTVSYYTIATDVMGLQTKSPTYTYTIFGPKEKTLALYSAGSTPPGYAVNDIVAYYMDGVAAYDIWDVKHYGVDDLTALIQSYNTIIELGGIGGTSGMPTLTSVGAWLKSGTTTNPKLYFLSDQDHGWISGFADTTFADTNVHAQYFGVKTLGPQDICYNSGMGSKYVEYPWNIIPVAGDTMTNYLNAYGKANSVNFWYDPFFELGYDNWFDNIIPTADAKVIFRDTTTMDATGWTDSAFPMFKATPALRKNRVLGVRKSAPDKSWATVYLAFDYLATDFRSDTSMHPNPTTNAPTDPKYKWILDVGNVVTKFIANPFVPVGVEKINTTVPGSFALAQNYPNPFNPTTTINYSIAAKSHVTLKVLNVIGQEVATLVDQVQDAGSFTVPFAPSSFSSGVYFYTLTAGSFTQTHKMVLMK